jgi:putative multiple sugar transport system substrate-binding protein
MKKIFATLFMVLSVFALVACAGDDSGGEGRVGVSMPSLSLERWERDGNNISENLKDLGFDVDLQFAQDDVQTQISQIENMITNEVDVLVIAPIDGETLTEVLGLAHSKGIPVIAYDRLIINSEYVNYYVTFDNFHVGVTQGRFLVDELGLGQGTGPFNIELFAGSPDDNNAHFFFSGAMSILQPYIENGELMITSEQTDFTQMAIPGWSTADAQTRMDNLLSAHYTNTDLHAVLSPNDSLALGIVSSLQSLGFGETRAMPLITGQDADLANVRSILEGGQAMSVFKDTRILADAATRMVQEILNDTTVTINDTETYDNGIKVVPTYLADVITITADNVREVLIDTEFYTAAELGLE